MIDLVAEIKSYNKRWLKGTISQWADKRKRARGYQNFREQIFICYKKEWIRDGARKYKEKIRELHDNNKKKRKT